MPINLQALSITNIIDSIQNFYNSQENNSKWSSLTTGTEGFSFTRFISSILSDLSYRLVTARRENFLSTANLVSSNVGIAVNNGYSVYRGNNQKRTITVTPIQTLVIPPLSILGTYNTDYDIINLKELNLVTGVNQDIEVVIGNVKNIQINTGTNEVTLFQLFQSGISEDFLLYKDYGTSNQIILPTTNIVRNLIDDLYLVRTNPYKSVDILYLNNNPDGQYKYGSETILTLQYIELADVPTTPFNSDMFDYFSLVNTKIIDLYKSFDSISNIKIKSPLYHETQNLIRAKDDFRKNIVEIIPSVIGSGYKIHTPTYADITYLKDDLTVLTDSELNILNETFNSEEFLGTPNPDITSPKLMQITLDIIFKLKNQYINISDINSDIENILNSNYTNKLVPPITEYDINIYDIEVLFEQLSYLKYARANIHVGEWTSNKKQYLGDIIEVNNVNYLANSILGNTGNSEPFWQVPITPTRDINTGLETIDNGVVWRAYKKLKVDNLKEWSANSKKKIGDFVYTNQYPNYMFKCVDLIKHSASNSPDFSQVTLGEFVNDGDIVWVCKNLVDIDSQRNNNYNYRIGDSIRVNNYSFQCVSYSGSSDSIQGSFELPIYNVLNFGVDYFDINGDYTNFFSVNDILKVNTALGNTYSFSVNNVSLIGSVTRIIVNQQVLLTETYLTIEKQGVGVFDGSVYWTIVPDITQIKYPWNCYFTFNYNLVTK
jgi:hypothetical protein